MTREHYRKLACAVALATSFTAIPGVSSAEEGAADAAVTASAAGETAASEAEAQSTSSSAAGKEQAAADAALQQTAGNVAADTRSERISDWAKLRPTEEAIEAYKKKYEGKTIVDIEFDGATEATRATAQKAATLHVGDTYTAKGLDQDLAALLDTGY